MQASIQLSETLKSDKSSSRGKDNARILVQAKKRSSSVGKRYPTQYMKVGEIKCVFLSCFYRGRSPLIALGPSWPFTFVLLLLAGLISCYFYMMLSVGGDRANPWHKLWCHFCIATNLFALFAGILKNPGIPQRLLDRLLKEQ